jgi:CHAT domain-containing protein/tetratricopeptide (TPR) repeat protein
MKDSPAIEPAVATAGGAAEDNGFVPLFNGKDKSGWKTQPEWEGDWHVEDGVLRWSGLDRSLLWTKCADYRDFHLRVETRISNRQYGQVIIRDLFGQAGDGHSGYPIVLNSTNENPSKTGSLGIVGGGTVVSVLQSLVAPDQWFMLEVIAEGNRVIVKVDGHTTADYSDPEERFARGHITLLAVNQVREGQRYLEFRKIELKTLPSVGKPDRPRKAAVPDVLPQGSVWKGTRTYREGAYAPATVTYELHVQEREGTKFKGHVFDNGAGRNRAEVEGEVEGEDITWRERSVFHLENEMNMRGTLHEDTIHLTFNGYYGKGRPTNTGDGVLRRVKAAQRLPEEEEPPGRPLKVIKTDNDEPARKLSPDERWRLEAELRQLQSAGWGYLRAGKLQEATTTWEKAVTVARQLHPNEDDLDLAISLGDLAYVLMRRGRLADAESLFRDALEMFKRLRGGDHLDVARGLMNLSVVLRERMKYAEAAQLTRDAAAMFKRLYGGDHPLVLSSLKNLGTMFAEQGKLTEAELVLRDVLNRSRRLYGDDNARVAAVMEDLGVVLKRQHRFSDAEPLLRGALEMDKRLARGDSEEVVGDLHNWGNLLALQGKLSDAEHLLRDALEMEERLNPGDDGILVNYLQDLTHVLLEQGRLEDAESLARRALGIDRRRRQSDERVPINKSLYTLARVLRAEGKSGEAEPLFREAIRIDRSYIVEFAEQASEGDALTLVASVGLARNGYFSAASSLKADPASVYSEAWSSKAIITQVVAWRQLAARAASSNPKAAAILSELTDLRRRRAELILAPTPADPVTRKQRDEDLRRMADSIAQLDHNLRPLLPAIDRANRLAKATPADLQKVLPPDAVVVDFLRSSHSELPKEPGTDVKQFDSYLAFIVSRDRIAWVDLGAAKPIEDAVADWRGAIVGERFKITDKVLASLQTGGTPGAVVSKLNRLKGREFDTREQLFLELAAVVDKEELQHFQNLVFKLTPTGSTEYSPELPAKVRELIWAKVRKEIPDGVKLVYISPDSALCRVPWAALPGDDPQGVLLEDYTLAVIPNAVFLLDKLWPQDPVQKSTTEALVVGNVAYDAEVPAAGQVVASRGDLLLKPDQKVAWPALDWTAAEVKGVSGAAGKRRFAVRTLTDKEAAPSAVLAALPRARYAHLATHGFFADPSFRSAFQLDSGLFEASQRGGRVGAGALSPLVMTGLVFAGANRPDTAGRGIVTGEALVDLDLSGLDLAVLSACETGLGDVAGGEGTFGLQRAFHLAGTRDVVASLWKVPDQATAALMGEFYRNLWEKNLPPVEALQQAQLTIYRSTPEKRAELAAGFRGTFKVVPGSGEEAVKPAPNGKAHPRLWAAFTLSGPGR